MTAYPFDLPSVCEGVDIQDAMLFSKPYGGLDWRPIPFETLQIEISLTRKWGKALARHGNTFMRDAVACCLVTLYQECGYHPCSLRLLESVMAERIETKAFVHQLALRM
jgi:hypothetical protein